MINLYDLLEACNGQLFGESAAHLFSNFCYDAQSATEAPLFVARRTDQGDTHALIESAIQAGAVGVLCSTPPTCDTEGITVIIVRDTERALLQWAKYVLSHKRMGVILVTGSVGKSLTVEAIRQVLSVRHPVYTVNDCQGVLGLPAALSGLRPEHAFIVLECGVYHPGEMSEWLEVVQPSINVITNLRLSRLESFASLDDIRAEHAQLIERMSGDGFAVLNLDDEYTPNLRMLARNRVATFGIDQFGADVMAYNIVLGATKTGFDLRFQGERFLGRWLPWLGKHQLYAALSALTVGVHVGLPMEDCLRALTELHSQSGRMNPLNGLHNALLIDDTWNATPQSVIEALNWFQAVQEHSKEGGRLIFILGGLDHLGHYSETAHRQIGGRAAEVAHVIITNGTEAAFAGVAALEAGRNKQDIRMTYSPRDALIAVRDLGHLSARDTLFITGGAHARMERIAQSLLKNTEDREFLPRNTDVIEQISLAPTSQLSRVEIDLDALAGNVRSLKALVGDAVTLTAVVKANAYGHGAVAVSRTALLNGAEHLAVSSVSEALELVEAGIDAPILVMNYTPVGLVRQVLRHNIILTVYDTALAKAYNQVARDAGYKLRVHAKVDTGMGRLGVLASEAAAFFRAIMTLPNLEVEGVFTHFATADSDLSFSAQQTNIFRGVLKMLRASGFQFKYTHAANSAGTLASMDYHFNMVRVGIALYGLSPSEQMPVPGNFRPVMSWKTNIAQLKTLPAGHTVGYGRTHSAEAGERVAILPIGYADGFRRAPIDGGEVLIHGQRAAIIGRVSMEKTAVNVSHIPDVTVGDEVVLLGRQGSESISADDIARRWGTINYEVVTSILARQPRR